MFSCQAKNELFFITLILLDINRIYSSKTLASGKFPAENPKKRKNNLLWGLLRTILNYIQTMKLVQYSNAIAVAAGCRVKTKPKPMVPKAQRPIQPTARTTLYKGA
jgi:hypothetical protein